MYAAAWLRSSPRHLLLSHQKELSNELLPFIEMKMLSREGVPGDLEMLYPLAFGNGWHLVIVQEVIVQEV